ncbi:hypothetical protein LPJ53_000790 [Coemansia erecta]|uniref:Uncharacterized protein n=1 Tax=Coemansia erecta TaxID=147472 RepID=A0A9W7Y4T2_9FUNG|nr:hypothetical protein LPJ53_000790 [Coemansia erecta]
MFKRSKPSSVDLLQNDRPDPGKDSQRPRHIKRRPTTSDGSYNEKKQHQQQQQQKKTPSGPDPAPRKNGRVPPAAPANDAHAGKPKAGRVVSESRAHRSSRKFIQPTSLESASDVDDLPTPERSIDENYGSYYSRNSKKGHPRSASKGVPATPQSKKADDSLLGLYRLTTPPLDSRAQQPELDPFEDSPPPRPLTDFEDPVYIPPLTLAATLVDDYGMADIGGFGSSPVSNATGSTVRNTRGSGGASVPAVSRTSTAATVTPSASGTKAGTGNADFLSDFNATYNYFFGSLPSDAVTSTLVTSDSGARAAPNTTSRGGMLSPMSTDAVRKPLKDNEGENSANESESDGSDSSSSSSGSDSDAEADNANSEAEREQEEERRKEEERKAAELRTRRREQLKQQVAFERMKERHRRQYPSQSTGAAPNNIARWQKESANAVGLTASTYGQTTLNSSHATINRGYAQGPQAQTPTAAAHGSGGYSGLHTNASMPNIGYSTEGQYAGGGSAVQAASVQRQGAQPQHQPLLIDTSGASRAVAINGYHHNGYGSLPHSAQASSGGYPPLPHQNSFLQMHMQHQQMQPVADSSVPSTHPVKLAMTPKSSKNPYLSDSSNDDASDTNSHLDSDDLSSIGSSDISCDAPPAEDAPAKTPVGPVSPSAAHKMGGVSGVPISRSISQPAMPRSSTGGSQTAASDSSSETSVKSQSSSKRRVRFHETVSVVFSARNSTTEDDVTNSMYDSGDDSSNASVDLNPRTVHSAIDASTRSAGSGSAGYSQDEAFDDAGGFSHSRYQLPPTFTAPVGNGVQWYDGDSTTVTNSKVSSSVSSRNISPDGAKSRKQKPKQRFETEPLRDHEAEREQQRALRQASKAEALAKQASNQRPMLTPPKQTQGARLAANDTLSSTDSTSTASASTAVASTATTSLPVDPVTEARRALLGHYNVPNPSMPIGNGIPRSNSTTSSFARASSVKVLQPQSFARAKSKPSKTKTAPSSSRKSFSERNAHKVDTPSTADTSKNLASSTPPSSQTPSLPQFQSKAAKRPEDIEGSQEFNFTNVLQNFSIASFEVGKDKEGGTHIRYSNRDTAASDDDSSDGDDLPLSRIVRSKSEPGTIPPRHSADDYMSRMGASAGSKDGGSRSYDSDNIGDASEGATGNGAPKNGRRFFGRNHHSSNTGKKVLMRNSTAPVVKSGDSSPLHLSEMRSQSMDAGTRHAQSSAAAINGGKSRFSRFISF